MGKLLLLFFCMSVVHAMPERTWPELVVSVPRDTEHPGVMETVSGHLEHVRLKK